MSLGTPGASETVESLYPAPLWYAVEISLGIIERREGLTQQMFQAQSHAGLGRMCPCSPSCELNCELS